LNSNLFIVYFAENLQKNMDSIAAVSALRRIIIIKRDGSETKLKIAEIGVIAPVDITPGELQLMKEKLKK
jgi:hypothetical protein